MSGITEDGSQAASDGLARRLYDPAFKLFGRTIPVSSDCEKTTDEDRVAISNESPCFQDVGDEAPESEDESSVPDELGSSSGSNEGCDEEKVIEVIRDGPENPVIPTMDLAREDVDAEMANPEDDGQADTSLDQAPKKPDKPVPCPRCESLDTKFCYFNNYNVNQPRHFCKNCQRYWTAGGTLRNVPVGAGRRKNKHSVTHQRSMLPDGMVVRCDAPEKAQKLLSCPGSSPVGMSRHIKTGLPSSSSRHLLPSDVHSLAAALESPSSSTVLNFGQESPICGSTGATPFTPCRSEVLQGYKPEMSQAQAKFNLKVSDAGSSTPLDTDKRVLDAICQKEQSPPGIASGTGNEAVKPAFWKPVQPFGEPAARSMESAQVQVPFTVTAKPEAGAPSDMPNNFDAALAWASAPFSLVGGPWQYGANLGWGNVAPATAIANAMQGAMCPSSNSVGAHPPQAANFVTQPPWAAAIGSLWSGVPWPFMQSPLWGPPAWGGAWTMPWAAPVTAAAAVAATAAAAAAANPALGNLAPGKRPREQGEIDGDKGGSLLVPKTLRIDDPGEAAQSSIWATLGLGKRSDTFGSGGIFRNFQSKAEMKETDDSHAQARNSNPAAMNRSVVFQENNLAS